MIQLAGNSDASRFTASPTGRVAAKSRLHSAKVESFKNISREGNPSRFQPARNPKNTIPAVNRAMDLIGILAEGEDETNTKALALRLEIPFTTCYRILCSLIGRGWVQRVADGRHVLSLGLRPILQPLPWAEQAAGVMQVTRFELAGRVRSEVMVSMRQGDYAVPTAHGEATH